MIVDEQTSLLVDKLIDRIDTISTHKTLYHSISFRKEQTKQ